MAVEERQKLPAGISQDLFDEVLSRALESIPRSDQRRWAELYVRGLLTVDGKKTMRGLAGGAGNSVEQSLYQFITKSTWQCGPVRRAVAELLTDRLNPRAWVAQPLVITKIGEHSVGVERQWVPHIGRIVNCQQASGVWLVSEQGSCPVDWRLALPECWTDHPERRRRASIPRHVDAAPPEICAIGSVDRMAAEWRLPGKPVVTDLRDADPYAVCAELNARQIPFVVRIDPASRFALLEPFPQAPAADPGGGADALTAALSRTTMPVEWYDHTTDTVRATSVGTTRVRMRRRRAGAPVLNERQEMVLLGAWTVRGRRTPGEYWLSNLSRPQLGTVYRTAMLARRVSDDLASVTDRLGARDFEGRSFRGWHHHMTMVTVAHAVSVLAGVPAPAQVPAPRRAQVPA
ncbi:IS701 family transposase [Streptomyces sp. NPDC088789]|uniref:IS701 family transposase n=1 Tax=Streptomyces sp. NPDC088789 TaxID=3365899 RepID=UPI00382E65FC